MEQPGCSGDCPELDSEKVNTPKVRMFDKHLAFVKEDYGLKLFLISVGFLIMFLEF